MSTNDLPKISGPADRALAAANITTLQDLTHWRAADLLKLHGFGPKGLATLRAALAAAGLSLADE